MTHRWHLAAISMGRAKCAPKRSCVLYKLSMISSLAIATLGK